MITEYDDHTGPPSFLIHELCHCVPANTLALQLEIVYLPCLPDANNLAARYRTVAPDTLGGPPLYLPQLSEV